MSFNSNHIASRVYYDIVVSNLNTTSSSNPILSFQESRSNPFVYSPQNYYMSIIRFSIDTCSLPIFVPTIQIDQSDSNLTIYSVSMTYNGITVQAFMNFVPQDKTQTIPSSPISTPTGLQIFSEYYYVYNYEYLISLLNTTLTTCFTSLQSTYSGTLPTANIPYLKWDSINKLASLVTDQAGFDNSSSNYIGLYFNNALYQLFSSFPMLLQSTTSITGLNYQLACNTYGTTNTISGSYEAQILQQEYSTISVWNPVMSIVFTSNTMPIVCEQLSAPLVFLNGKTKQSTNTSNIAHIITDFEANDGVYKPNLVYQPNIYRYTELIGNIPLNSIDIRAFWKNRLGELIPFYLNTGCSASLKFMFCLKDTQN
jgi:hypothetical protein